MVYNELRTLSFRLKEDLQLQRNFQVMNFPGRSELLQLQAELTGRPIDRVSIPIRLLNTAMRALIPDLIYIAPNAGRNDANRDGNYPWLYSETAINPEALYLIINAWVQTEFSRASDVQKREVLQYLQPKKLIWQPTEVNTAKWTVGQNGTAYLGTGEDQFILLPHILAAQFSKPDVSLRFGSETLEYRRAPMRPGTKGAEIISWKPIDYNGWYWSVVITFTAQTIPFQSYPVIHTDISLRRWGSQRINDLTWDKETSIYLLTNVPWIEGLQNSQSFQVAPIGRGRLPSSNQQNSGSQYGWIWGSGLPALLDRLNRQRQFPTPESIINDPASALNLSDSPNAALVYRNGIKPAHDVEPGLSPGNRRELAEQIAELLKYEWEFVEAPTRVSNPLKRLPNHFFLGSTAISEESQAQLCRAINQCVGGYLTIEIWFQNQLTADTIIKSICNLLGISESELFPYTFPDLNFTLNIQPYILGSPGDRLQLDSNISSRIERRRQAINQRCRDVEAHVPQSSGITVAFIELDGADKFPDNTDPKDALRKGFTMRGRWTQFISTGNSENLPHRATKGFLDLLRQLGVQAQPPQFVIESTQNSKKKATNEKGLPKKINYVGIWMIKQNSSTSSDGSTVRLPVMIYMTSDTTEIKAIAPGLGNDWLPYREVLLRIGRGEAQGYQRPEDAVARFIKPKLNDVLSLGDTLLLCHAQNLRSTWNWLTNGNITQDSVNFGRENLSKIEDFDSNLRIVRVRDSQSHETPEWYAQNGGDGNGFSEGIFQMGERVFASTYNTPKQFKLNRDLSKASTWTTRNKKTKEEKSHPPSPDVYYWNPGLVELTVACVQPGDNPSLWAALAHELRHIALHHDEPLKLPLPLHLAKLIEDYVLLIENDSSSDSE